MTKKCIVCGKNFESVRDNSKTCSATCRQKNCRKNKAAVPDTTAIKKTQPTKIETIKKTTAPPVVEEQEERVSSNSLASLFPKTPFRRGPYINDAIRKKNGLKPNN